MPDPKDGSRSRQRIPAGGERAVSGKRLRLAALNAEEAELYCGLPVRVLFERHGEIYYPVFEPAGSGS